MSQKIVPFALKDAPALIERLLPVQKLSAESYKEQMAGSGKTLTALGSYWKGRKPLILAKACVLGCLLPATGDNARDLEIFEMLMGMDAESFVARWKRSIKPRDVLGGVAIARIRDYFDVTPDDALPQSAPVDWSRPEIGKARVAWRDDVTPLERRRLEARLLPDAPYREWVDAARRPEEIGDDAGAHIWEAVNAHLGTDARSFPELVEQLGIMRFGRRPRVADTFCGSGQIPFEAARLGCDVYASDLNPVACMLTWGALNIVGGTQQYYKTLAQTQHQIVQEVQAEIDALGVECDQQGWRAKVFLYCLEARCPQTGWMVPLLPNLVVSSPKGGKGNNIIAQMVPNYQAKRYDIVIKTNVSSEELASARKGTITRDSRFEEASLEHQLDGITYRTKISTLRGDYQDKDGTTNNRLRLWQRDDFKPLPTDIFQDRLYCIQWIRPKATGRSYETEFRAVTEEDIAREEKVESYVADHLAEWQANGWIPDSRIEPGGPPRYEGLSLIRSRGWTYWHHLFNPRQLLIFGLSKKAISVVEDRAIEAGLTALLTKALDYNSKLTDWAPTHNTVNHTFANQALNTIYNPPCRAYAYSMNPFLASIKQAQVSGEHLVKCADARSYPSEGDLYITDPPYGDAVKYEEILEFFIAWLRKNPPPEFAGWVWDSRRALAIKGEGEDFRQGMVAAYSRMTGHMPDNGLQVIMFTHQSGAIWADMANIVWAAGLQVTAAWYVVTETDSALREGSYVKGTVLLVCRKRHGQHKTTRDDLAWEIQEEVEAQIASLTGLNQQARGLYRDANVFEDADLQMAGYAAALRALTRYAIIDGRDMTREAARPRVKGETTFVDELIAFAVDTANRSLVPRGIDQTQWRRLNGAERFYLKMVDMEARGARTLDNYQNFAKAFKVRDFRPFMADLQANNARLRNAVEFGRAEMGEGSELHESTLRAVLYAMMELQSDVDGAEALAHLTHNIPNSSGDMAQRELAIELAGYLAGRLDHLRPDEAGAARVLRELILNQRLG